MRPSFIVEFIALLLLGPLAALATAAAGAVARVLAGSTQPGWRSAVPHTATTFAALAAAGAAQVALGGSIAWPWQTVPIAAAIGAHCLVTAVGVGVIIPALTGGAIDRSWPERAVMNAPAYVVGASLAVGLSALIEHKLWTVLPVVAVPLGFCWEAYRVALLRKEEDRRRREVLHLLDEGMCVVDHTGCVMLWTDALARILDRPRERALGRPIGEAVPAAAARALQRAIHEASSSQSGRALNVERPSAKATRLLEVRIVPVAGGLSGGTRNGSGWPLKARPTGCGNGISAPRSSTSRPGGGRCSAFRRRPRSVVQTTGCRGSMWKMSPR
jgi:PAS domain-containing protein